MEQITIRTSSGAERFTTDINERSIIHCEMMRSHYIELRFSTREPVYFQLGDYADTDFGRFEMVDLYNPSFNKNEGSYDYTLRLDAQYYKFKNKILRYKPSDAASETSFKLTANLPTHIAMVMQNINALGTASSSYLYNGTTAYTSGIEGTIDQTAAKYINYDSLNIIDAMTAIAETFECEWWFEDSILKFGRCAVSGTEQVLTIGENVESMTRSDSKKIFATRIYAFGSDKNLPTNYRTVSGDVVANGVVQRRLMLPASTPYVQSSSVQDENGAVEGVVIFDDVYPKLNNSVATCEPYSQEEEGDEGETVTVTYYDITDASGVAFSESYILEGKELRIVFNSGSMQGMDFAVEFNPNGVDESDAGSQVFRIVPNDDYGRNLPDSALHPNVGDSYTLYGWDATKLESMNLVTTAENALLTKAQEYLVQAEKDPSTYNVIMMSEDAYNDGIVYNLYDLGQPVRLVNPALFSDGRSSRVIGYEFCLDIPYDSPQYIVGEAVSYSRIEAVESGIDAITYNGVSYTTQGGSSSGGGPSIYVIALNDNTRPTSKNVYSAARSDYEHLSRLNNDTANGIITFEQRQIHKKGIRTRHYDLNPTNEDNLWGKGFELVMRDNGRSRLEVDELLVRLKAYFAELEIRKLSYVGGNYFFSAAGSRIFHVVEKTSVYRCYLYSDDGTTATTNYWRVNDQARCQIFNIDEGVHTGATNKFYWRRVTNYGKEVIAGRTYEDGTADTTEYQFVDLSKADCALSSDIPEVDDTIVQVGNWTDSARQGVIYLIVEGESAPAILEYSGVGANGNHFVLPDPTLQLSPHGNIIYGEFHSVNVSGGSSSTPSIDDQIAALIESLDEIRSQTDSQFQIWYGSGIPTTSNLPASSWTDDDTKAMHLGDIYYDTTREPAQNGGRAWKWEVNNGIYSWQPITDQDTIAALDMIRNVASDGIITGGAEKGRLFMEWMQTVDNYTKYWHLAADYVSDASVSTARTGAVTAFNALAKMLNNGVDLVYDLTTRVFATPAWLTNLGQSTTVSDPDVYRQRWDEWYAALSNLVTVLSDYIGEARNIIEKMADDSILTPQEKCQLLVEWNAVYLERYGNATTVGLDTQAANARVSAADYDNAYDSLATYLNGGSPLTPGATPVMLGTLINEDSSINSDFVTLWANYYAARADLISKIGNSKVSVFVSSEAHPTPVPPYHVGDMWIQSDGNTMICVTERLTGSYSAADWKDLSDMMVAANMADYLEMLAQEIMANVNIQVQNGTRVNFCTGTMTDGDMRISTDGYLQYYDEENSRWRNAPVSRYDIAYYGGDAYMYEYDEDNDTYSWANLNHDALADIMSDILVVNGFGTLCIYLSTSAITPNKYDLYFRDKQIYDFITHAWSQTGGRDVMYYDGATWKYLGNSTTAMLENLGNAIRAVVFDANGQSKIDLNTQRISAITSHFTFDPVTGNITHIDSSGIVTTANYASLFSTMTDADGNIIAQAHLNTYVTKVDGVIESGVSINADKVNFNAGMVMINNKFWVDSNGNVNMNNATMNDATVKGNFYAPYFEITNSNIDSVSTTETDSTLGFSYKLIDLDKTGLNISISTSSGIVYISLPTDDKYLGAEANIICNGTNYVVLRNISRLVGKSTWEYFHPMLYMGQKMQLKCVRKTSTITNHWVSECVTDAEQPMPPITLACCTVDVGYFSSQWSIFAGYASDYMIRGTFSGRITRSGTGKYRVDLPTAWDGYYNFDECTIMVWGLGYVYEGTSRSSSKFCKATLLEKTSTYFTVGTSDDDSANDGSFGFQIILTSRINEYII